MSDKFHSSDKLIRLYYRYTNGATIMRILKKLLHQLTTQEFTINLPYYVTKTLQAHEQAGDIELNKFVFNSIRKNAWYCSGESHLSHVQMIPIVVRLPRLMMWQIRWSALSNHTTVSSIVAEALSYSISHLLCELKTMENYRLEMESLNNEN